jgi:rhomboid protease GluP
VGESDDSNGRAQAAPLDGRAEAAGPSEALVTLGPDGPVIPELFGFVGLTAIGPAPSERTIRDHALVLQSMSLWHATRKTSAGWVLLVRDEDYARAAQAIERYEAENRDWPPPRRRERLRFEFSMAAPVIFAGLIAFYLVVGAWPAGPDGRSVPLSQAGSWFQRGAAVSDWVLTREPWRAVTALTLHQNAQHVFGNAISGTVFATALNRRIGWGGGSLAVLASGVIGNLANALWHHANGQLHVSIGASTAGFGAIGLLAGIQALAPPSESTRRSWLQVGGAIVGGVALLGALGSGSGSAQDRTDLHAHLFGFLAGCLIGLGAAFAMNRDRRDVERFEVGTSSSVARRFLELGSGEPRAWVQVVLGLIAATIVAASWTLAMRRG